MVKMPQIASRINVDVIDIESKYFGDRKFQYLDAITDNVNKEVSDIFWNCDSFNIIEIKRETDEANAMPIANDEKVLLESCDILPDEKILTGIKSTTTYLCHKCRQVFASRDLFETHYK